MLIRYSLALGATGLAAVPAFAAQATLKIDLPRMTVAEYHRPYVAAWIEKASDHGYAGTVAVWYDTKKRDDGGQKWLKDLRTWWRKSGHQALADGVSGATRTAGTQSIDLAQSAAVKALPPGEYELWVEAARENGGREVLHVPFTWPAKAQSAKAAGEGELGGVALEVTP